MTHNFRSSYSFSKWLIRSLQNTEIWSSNGKASYWINSGTFQSQVPEINKYKQTKIGRPMWEMTESFQVDCVEKLKWEQKCWDVYNFFLHKVHLDEKNKWINTIAIKRWNKDLMNRKFNRWMFKGKVQPRDLHFEVYKDSAKIIWGQSDIIFKCVRYQLVFFKL